MHKFAHVNAHTLAEALGQLHADSRPIAGGTDLLTVLKAGIHRPAALVNLKSLDDAGLRRIEQRDEGGLTLGALVTLDEIEHSDLIRQHYPALAQAAASAASPQLRNMGTIGGNLCQEVRCWYYRGPFNCWLKGGDTCFARDGENSHHAVFGLESPCVAAHPSDPAVALIALDARLRIAGQGGERYVAVDELYALPDESRRRPHTLAQDELIVAVELPAPPSRSHYIKAMDRQVWAFALASVAVALRLDGDTVHDARLVLGGVAPIPWRRHRAEQLLIGNRLTDERVREAARLAVDGATPLQHNSYKLPLVQGIVERALSELL